MYDLTYFNSFDTMGLPYTRVFFATEDGESFELPIAPQFLTVNVQGDNPSISLSGGGEVTMLSDPKLRTFKLSFLLPKNDIFVRNKNNFKKAEFYIDKFLKFKQEKLPVRFIVSVRESVDVLYDFNMLTSIESFTYEERGGEPYDYYVDMKLKEFIRLMVLEFKKAPVSEDKNAVVKEKTTPAVNNKDYTVVKGDTLYNIAKKHLGDGGRYMEIATLNGIKNPDKIYAGQALKLP